MSINILICDDSAEIRDYFTAILNADNDFNVIGTASNGREAIEFVSRKRPDIILMDIQMESETDGINATEEILKNNPKTKIIILTIHNSDSLIMDAYYAGASDYIIKTDNAENIKNSIKMVNSIDDFVGPIIARNIRNEMLNLKSKQDCLLFFIYGFSTLTKTEKEILKLLYEGKNKTEIAEIRVTELSTIISHIKHIKRKLNYRSTKNLVSFLKKLKIYEEYDL